MLFLGGWGQVAVCLQNLYEVVLCDFTKDMAVEKKIWDSAPYQHQANGQDSELPVELPSADNLSFFKQLKRLQTTLSTKESLFNVPKGLEARRRISFFSNSLFMTMPRAPSVLNISNSELCKLLQFTSFSSVPIQGFVQSIILQVGIYDLQSNWWSLLWDHLAGGQDAGFQCPDALLQGGCHLLDESA